MLSELQLEQLLYCLTGLSPKISVKDLDVKTRSQLKPDSKFVEGIWAASFVDTCFSRWLQVMHGLTRPTHLHAPMGNREKCSVIKCSLLS